MRWLIILCGIASGGRGAMAMAVLVSALLSTARADEPALPAELPKTRRGVGLVEMLRWVGLPQDVRVGHSAASPAWSGLRQLPPRTASLVLAQADLSAEEAQQYEALHAPTARAGPPRLRWVVWETFRRNYLDFEQVRWWRLHAVGAESSALQRDEESAGAATCQMEADDARWLAETLWWLTQLRLRERPRPPEEPLAFRGTSSSGTHGATGRLLLVADEGPVGELESYLESRWLGEEQPGAFVANLVSALLSVAPTAEPVSASGPRAESELALRGTLRRALADPEPWPLGVWRVLLTSARPQEVEAVRAKVRALPPRVRNGAAARKDFAAVLAEQRRRSDPAGLEPIVLARRQERGRQRAALEHLAALDPGRAERVLTRLLRRSRPEQWDWQLCEALPKAARTRLLARLADDVRVVPSARSEAESLLLIASLRDGPDEARLAAFLRDGRHPASARCSLLDEIYYESETRSPGAGLREVLAVLAADVTEDRLLRSYAALVLGAHEDARGLRPLLEFVGTVSGADRGSGARPRTLGALAGAAADEERCLALAALQAGVRTVQTGLGDLALGAWLGDLRELTDALRPFAGTDVLQGSTLREGTRTDSTARAVILAWQEPDPLTRAQLGAMLACHLRSPRPAELSALRRRLAALREALSPEELSRWREFVTALLLELRTVGSAPAESVVRELRR